MLTSAPVMTFIATKDAARAQAFYADVLGLRLVTDDSYALVFDMSGIMLRVTRVHEVVVAPYTVLGWKVADMVATRRGLVARGVVFERYPGLPQDDDGVCTFPDGTQVAWFKDPDGHTLSLTQFGPGAA
jgi:catechol 2,3-dioxygenase-like lactoylglutathione lyase family enzyme